MKQLHRTLLPLVALIVSGLTAQPAVAEQWLTYPGGDGPGNGKQIVLIAAEESYRSGLSIKQASPFRTTIIVELSNAVETIYVPHRAAYADGSYEVTNSALEPGGGEMLVGAALKLLRDAASAANEANRNTPVH